MFALLISLIGSIQLQLVKIFYLTPRVKRAFLIKSKQDDAIVSWKANDDSYRLRPPAFAVDVTHSCRNASGIGAPIFCYGSAPELSLVVEYSFRGREWWCAYDSLSSEAEFPPHSLRASIRGGLLCTRPLHGPAPWKELVEKIAGPTRKLSVCASSLSAVAWAEGLLDDGGRVELEDQLGRIVRFDCSHEIEGERPPADGAPPAPSKTMEENESHEGEEVHGGLEGYVEVGNDRHKRE